MLVKNIKFLRGNYQTDSSETLYCLYCSPINFLVAACLKTENDKNLFIKVSNRYRALRCFVFSVVSSSVYTGINNFICQLLSSKEETF